MVNVLLLNDGCGHLDGVADVLRETDCNVFEANDVNTAIRLIRENVFDVLFVLRNFGGVKDGGALVAMEASDKDKTTCIIVDEDDGIIEVISEILKESTQEIVEMRRERGE